MISYPSSLPTDAVMVVVSKLRGADVPLSQLGLAAWNLQGFAMSQMAGPNAVASTASCDEALLADTLENLTKETPAPSAAIPWQLLLPVILNLLQKWLTK